MEENVKVGNLYLNEVSLRKLQFMTKKIVAIHQPNFFPWLGYFNKISVSDIFIFLDDVQFPKKGGSWVNRVRLLVSNNIKWVTASVDRDYHGTLKINEMSFLEQGNWRIKVLKTVKNNYNKHPYYLETMEVFEPLLENKNNNIAEYNINSIITICKKININTSNLRRSSTIKHAQSSNELLCFLTKCVGGNIYMCGGGSDEYQKEEIFESKNIKLIYQNFLHPNYKQFNRQEFCPGLSIVDAAMNIGWKGLSEIFSGQINFKTK